MAWKQKEFPSQVAEAVLTIVHVFPMSHLLVFDWDSLLMFWVSTCGSCFFSVSWVVWYDCGWPFQSVRTWSSGRCWSLKSLEVDSFFFGVNYCQLFFLLRKFQDNQFQPRVQRYSQSILRANCLLNCQLRVQADSLVIWLSVIKKAILFSIKQLWTKNTIEVDYVRSRSGCDTAASTLHSLRCMMHQSHSMGIVSKLCLTCLQW